MVIFIELLISGCEVVRQVGLSEEFSLVVAHRVIRGDRLFAGIDRPEVQTERTKVNEVGICALSELNAWDAAPEARVSLFLLG